jgi:hypothetical protein
MMWVVVEPHQLKRTRRKKAKKVSHYKQQKLVAHRTWGGKGLIARLRETE